MSKKSIRFYKDHKVRAKRSHIPIMAKLLEIEETLFFYVFVEMFVISDILCIFASK